MTVYKIQVSNGSGWRKEYESTSKPQSNAETERQEQSQEPNA